MIYFKRFKNLKIIKNIKFRLKRNSKVLKSLSCFFTYILMVIFIVPYVITELMTLNITNNLNQEESIDDLENINDLEIDIINNLDIVNNNLDTTTSDLNNFEYYILGVVGAEMPISFNIEALKAQAIAGRTYAYKRINDINQVVDHTSIGQAYDSIDDLKAKWGNNFDTYYDKLYNAIYETQGIIMTYNDEPIEAVFHSTSAGITELSENIWGQNLPYITHVDSSLDEQAPNFIYSVDISNAEVIQKISSQYSSVNTSNIITSFEILERSEADYVLNVKVDNINISGRDIRTLFGLRSSNFSIIKNEDSITFTTKGYGHGAGMSQYGANFMAEDGSTYIEILNHYYTGIDLQKVY